MLSCCWWILSILFPTPTQTPDSDPDVIAALTTYGAVFNKTQKHAAECRGLLVGLMWVHQLDLHAVWSAASAAQHRILAKALRLDSDTHAASPPWLTMVVRKVLSACRAPRLYSYLLFLKYVVNLLLLTFSVNLFVKIYSAINSSL